MELILILLLIAGIGLSVAALCEKKTKGKAGIILLIIIMCFSIKALWSHMGDDNNSREEKCKVCDGTGYYQKKTCIFCDGTGEYNPNKDLYKSYKESFDD